jgi:flagellar basal-body rod protein FlgG
VTGDGYFVVEGPGGRVLTRNGTFGLNDMGELVNAIGQRVRGEGGTIQIPPNTSRIDVSLDGVVLADNGEVGRLQIVRVPNPATTLRRVGGTVFEGPTQPGQQELGDFRVLQGYQEASNVQPVTELVGLLTNMRYFEASQRVTKTIADALALNTRPQG